MIYTKILLTESKEQDLKAFYLKKQEQILTKYFEDGLQRSKKSRDIYKPFVSGDYIGKSHFQVMKERLLQEIEKGKLRIDNDIDYLSGGDVTKTKKYLPWMAKQVLELNQPKNEIPDLVKIFHDNIHKFKQKDINQYKTLGELRGEVEQVLASQEEEGQGEGSYFKIYDDKSISIIRPDSVKAACQYGRGSKWCIAATKSTNYMNSYSSRGIVFYFLILKQLNAKFAFAIYPGGNIDRQTLSVQSFFIDRSEAGIEIFDQEDNSISINTVQATIYGDYEYEKGLKPYLQKICDDYNKKPENYHTLMKKFIDDLNISQQQTFEKLQKMEYKPEEIEDFIFEQIIKLPNSSKTEEEQNIYIYKYFNLMLQHADAGFISSTGEGRDRELEGKQIRWLLVRNPFIMNDKQKYEKLKNAIPKFQQRRGIYDSLEYLLTPLNNAIREKPLSDKEADMWFKWTIRNLNLMKIAHSVEYQVIFDKETQKKYQMHGGYRPQKLTLLSVSQLQNLIKVFKSKKIIKNFTKQDHNVKNDDRRGTMINRNSNNRKQQDRMTNKLLSYPLPKKGEKQDPEIERQIDNYIDKIAKPMVKSKEIETTYNVELDLNYLIHLVNHETEMLKENKGIKVLIGAH